MSKPPTETLTRAEASWRTAVEARATELAPTDLQRAKEKLDRAKKAVAAGNHDEARRLAEAAQVEAELAEARAEATIMRWAADGLLRKVDEESQETAPKSSAAIPRRE